MAETAPETRTRGPLRVEKNHLLGLLGVLLLLDLITVGLAGYCMDKLIDGTLNGTNGATLLLVIVTLIGCGALVAAIVAGLLHFRHYNSGSVGSASATALIAWVIMILAFGFACKHIDLGQTGSRTRALEALVFILAFFETLYVLVLHAGLFNSKVGVGY